MNIDKTHEHGLAPGFLVALPQMRDANFAHSVVLVVEHGEDGAMGIIVNRPLPLPDLRDVSLTHDIELAAHIDDLRIFQGGFVETERGFLLHDNPGLPDSVQILPGLFLSGSVDSLRSTLSGATGETKFRLCLGYAGWAPGQLERELREGCWLPVEASARHIFGTPTEQIWDSVLRDIGIEPGRILQSSGLN
jgi:putative transcriptional regulator